MAKIAGTIGYVGASTAIAGITQWSLDYAVDMLETTDFTASGIGAYIPGVCRWSGTFSGYKDGAPQAIGASVNLWLAESASATQIWKGEAYISAVHPTTNFDGVVSYAYDFQGTASLTIPTT